MTLSRWRLTPTSLLFQVTLTHAHLHIFIHTPTPTYPHSHPSIHHNTTPTCTPQHYTHPLHTYQQDEASALENEDVHSSLNEAQQFMHLLHRNQEVCVVYCVLCSYDIKQYCIVVQVLCVNNLTTICRFSLCINCLRVLQSFR